VAPIFALFIFAMVAMVLAVHMQRIRCRMESVLTPSTDVLHRHCAEEQCCKLV
jgi:hypothetical protein